MRQPFPGVLLQRPRNLEGLAYPRVDLATLDAASDLEREERIAAGRALDLGHEGARKRCFQAGAEHVIESVSAERFQAEPMDLLTREAPLEQPGRSASHRGPDCSHHTEPFRLQAAHDEVEHPRGGAIHPLEIIYRHEHG